MSKTVVRPTPKTVVSSGPGRGNLPTAGAGKFDPKAFAKTLTADQQKDFRALGRNTGGDYLKWGQNAAKGAGQSFSPEEMLRRRYANKPAPKAPPTGTVSTGIPPLTPTGTTPAPAAAAPMSSGTAPGGGPVVSPSSSSASMASMSGDGGGGGGMGMGGSMQALNSPSRYRQGIGQRMPPVQTASLAALRKIY